jgi:predicted AlkP superfamily pyrophosphatase or phosphodiesterase
MIARLLGGLLLITSWLSRPPLAQPQQQVARPKLVVVVAIDQLRADYLQRFQRHFTQNGFNLLLRGGASFTEAHYQHSMTQTCPGHAAILTGSYANVNGIVANSWYNPALRRAEYCAADTSAKLIGASSEGRSPRNLLGFTVGDELKRVTSRRSRVIAIAGKDRSAIMLGGHFADAAYWTEDTLIVTSSYYRKELPAYVRRFNAQGTVTRYRGSTWERLLPATAYAMVGRDDVEAEENAAGMGRTFPHRLSAGQAGENFIQAFQSSPFENEILVEFAMEVVREERLGQDEDPDLLALGFSANDAVGHSYGPDSHEVMDMTLRTDRLLERFFAFLIRQVGRDNLAIVLTSDHGVAPLPELIRQRQPGLNALRIDPAGVMAAAEGALRARYGAPRRPAGPADPNWIIYQGYRSLYLNLPGLEDKGIAVEEAEQVAREAVRNVPGVEQALTGGELTRERNRAVHSRSELSYYPSRSGDVIYAMAPYVLLGAYLEGTDHGSPWSYDTHVPLLLFGSGVTPGRYTEAVGVADIAPTLSALLNIEAPAGSQGRLLKEALR